MLDSWVFMIALLLVSLVFLFMAVFFFLVLTDTFPHTLGIRAV
jgi:hypothetical protein